MFGGEGVCGRHIGSVGDMGGVTNDEGWSSICVVGWFGWRGGVGVSLLSMHVVTTVLVPSLPWSLSALLVEVPLYFFQCCCWFANAAIVSVLGGGDFLDGLEVCT